MLPAGESRSTVSYLAGQSNRVYLNYLTVDHPIPDMPLFLNRDRYVIAPLEATYNAAYEGMPAFWRDVLEGKIED